VHLIHSAVITIGIGPEIHIGPVSIAWHGLTIALGLVVGGAAAFRYARESDLDPDPLFTIGLIAAIGGIVGSRLFFILEHGGPILGTRGFTLAGGVILAGVIIAAYVLYRHLSWSYLDAAALGLPLGLAVGRIGDVINGEHYGAASEFFLAVRNSNPDALTPDPNLAYHNGGLYEVILGILVFSIVWPLRHRIRRPGQIAWLVLGLISGGRFVEFFVRSDSPDLTLGLSNTQWTSLAMFVAAAVGYWVTSRSDTWTTDNES